MKAGRIGFALKVRLSAVLVLFAQVKEADSKSLF
jgi:hypothetical protein